MKYAIYRANGRRYRDLTFDTRSEAVETLNFLTGDPYTKEEYRGAYVDAYIPKGRKEKTVHPFGL